MLFHLHRCLKRGAEDEETLFHDRLTGRASPCRVVTDPELLLRHFTPAVSSMGLEDGNSLQHFRFSKPRHSVDMQDRSRTKAGPLPLAPSVPPSRGPSRERPAGPGRCRMGLPREACATASPAPWDSPALSPFALAAFLLGAL